MKPELNLNLKPVSVEGMEVLNNTYDLLYDLHQYLDYVQSRDIKRKTRDNALPAPDVRRLLKTFSDPKYPLAEFNEMGSCLWLDFVDYLALDMELVDYDIQGAYRSYNSQSPTFSDNYILPVLKNIEAFIQAPPEQQILQITNNLINREHEGYSRYPALLNEFMTKSLLGFLNTFPRWGSGAGLLPSLNLPKARAWLLTLLKDCQPGTWYRVQDLVACLKSDAPYFLFPEEIPEIRGKKISRYTGFHESLSAYERERAIIPDNAPDAFERVEGRFIERFFENIPLLMGFVHLAYDPEAPGMNQVPSLGHLAAFRLQSRFVHMMDGEINPAKVTILPNFEVLLESEFYPHQTVRQISRFAEPLKQSLGETGACLFTFRLDKEKVAKALVEEADLDVLALLKNLSHQPIPGNVATEIEEWSGHAEIFTLYEGYCLVESAEALPEIEAQTVLTIAPTLRLIDDFPGVITTLEKAEKFPFVINHLDQGFEPVHKDAITLFPRADQTRPDKTEPEPITIQKETLIRLRFPTEKVLKRFMMALAEARVPIHVENETLTLTVLERYQANLEKIARSLADTYQIHFEE